MAFHLRATEKVNSVNEDEELRKRGFQIGTTLGEGSYAKVKCAYSEKYGKKVALKIINRRKAPKDFQRKFLPRELEVMRMLNHPNVVHLIDVMQFGGKVFMVLEMAGHGDLLEYIKLRGAITEDRARQLFYQLCSALHYLHQHNVVHRDLKCENVLLDVRNNIKISDFGFARQLLLGETSRTFCGSAAYAAPEILQGIPYSGCSYDIWSLGVILYIMVCGSMPYDDTNIKKMIRYQTERKVGFSKSKKLSTEVKNVIHRMLESDISLRITIPEIYEMVWMSSHMDTFRQQEVQLIVDMGIKMGSTAGRDGTVATAAAGARAVKGTPVNGHPRDVGRGTRVEKFILPEQSSSGSITSEDECVQQSQAMDNKAAQKKQPVSDNQHANNPPSNGRSPPTFATARPPTPGRHSPGPSGATSGGARSTSYRQRHREQREQRERTAATAFDPPVLHHHAPQQPVSRNNVPGSPISPPPSSERPSRQLPALHQRRPGTQNPPE